MEGIALKSVAIYVEKYNYQRLDSFVPRLFQSSLSDWLVADGPNGAAETKQKKENATTFVYVV